MSTSAGISAAPSVAAGGSAPRGLSVLHRLLSYAALDSRRPMRDLLVGFAAGGLGVALNVGIYAAAGWYHVQSVQFDLKALLVAGLLGYLWIGVWEEFLIRGVAFRLLERGFGSIAALVASSLAFGLLHLGNPGATLIGALATAAAAGVMLGAAYLLTRNLWLAIGIHWAADFWQGAIFGLHPSGTSFEHPLLQATLAGPRLWTGDDYGGGIVGLTIGCGAGAVLLVWAVRRHHLQPWRLPVPHHDRHVGGDTVRTSAPLDEGNTRDGGPAAGTAPADRAGTIP
jgi:membrane protease YdiL (CAAX protease family)